MSKSSGSKPLRRAAREQTYGPAHDPAHDSAPHTAPDRPAAAEVGFAATPVGRALLKALNDSDTPTASSTRVIAEAVLRHPLRTAALGIEELAAQAGVSTASVSRFARQMGFAGYPALRAAIADGLQSVLQPVEKLRATIERGASAAPAHDSLTSAAARVQSAAASLNAATVDALVQELTAARAVYVMGFGLSSHVAGALALGLQPFCTQVITVVEYGGTEVAAGRLMNIGAEDVLIVISLPRYAVDVVRLAQYARDRRARVVAITDSPASPLAPLADRTLIAPADHPVLPSSFVAPLAVAEALVAALMVSNRRNVNKAARLTDAISSYLVTDAPPSRSSRTRRSST